MGRLILLSKPSLILGNYLRRQDDEVSYNYAGSWMKSRRYHNRYASLLNLEYFQKIKQQNEDDLIYLECHRYDKYGRLLAHLYQSPDDTYSFNEILRIEGLAYEYNGGPRKPFDEWIKTVNIGHEDYNRFRPVAMVREITYDEDLAYI